MQFSLPWWVVCSCSFLCGRWCSGCDLGVFRRVALCVLRRGVSVSWRGAVGCFSPEGGGWEHVHGERGRHGEGLRLHISQAAFFFLIALLLCIPLGGVGFGYSGFGLERGWGCVWCLSTRGGMWFSCRSCCALLCRGEAAVGVCLPAARALGTAPVSLACACLRWRGWQSRRVEGGLGGSVAPAHPGAM